MTPPVDLIAVPDWPAVDVNATTVVLPKETAAKTALLLHQLRVYIQTQLDRCGVPDFVSPTTQPKP
jgi:hypothetical protein